MRSSYIENEYGELIKQYVMIWKPKVLVELGVLDGYSTLNIAMGLQDINSSSKLDAYDLFDEYQFKHGYKKEVEKMLSTHNVSQYVNLVQGNAYHVYKNYADYTIDLLHIDISNTGKVIHDLIEVWHPKIKQSGVILIEGGSEERDKVQWMLSHNMPSIKRELEENIIINDYYMYSTYQKFPSLTVMIRNIHPHYDYYGKGW